MDEQTFSQLTSRLDKLELMLTLQGKLLDEILCASRAAQSSSAFSVDAVNGIYGVLGRISARGDIHIAPR